MLLNIGQVRRAKILHEEARPNERVGKANVPGPTND